MQEYEKKIRRRSQYTLSGSLLCCSLGLFLGFFGKDRIDPMPLGFLMGLLMGFAALGLALWFRWHHVLRNEEALRAAYAKDNDERSRMIQEKSGLGSLRVSIAVICVGMMVSIFFDTRVFLTLNAVLFLFAVAKIALVLYYSHKY